MNLSRMHFRRKQLERRYLQLEGKQADDHWRDRDIATAEVIQTAILQLPYRQCAAIVLRFYADIPDEETAEILGCAVGSVRSLVSRGTTALRDLIGSDIDA